MDLHPMGLLVAGMVKRLQEAGAGQGVVDGGDALPIAELQHAAMAGHGEGPEQFRSLAALQCLGRIQEVPGLLQKGGVR
jgi:hypothetical protein